MDICMEFIAIEGVYIYDACFLYVYHNYISNRIYSESYDSL